MISVTAVAPTRPIRRRGPIEKAAGQSTDTVSADRASAEHDEPEPNAPTVSASSSAAAGLSPGVLEALSKLRIGGA